ncbi:complement component C6 [Aplochiton taeniatus]
MLFGSCNPDNREIHPGICIQFQYCLEMFVTEMLCVLHGGAADPQASPLCFQTVPSMARLLLVLLAALGSLWVSQACFCDHYPWSSWTVCTRTCNYGTQERRRHITYDDYYWKNSCQQLCKHHELRACNLLACPLHCRLDEFGPWSQCSPCAKMQYRTRSLRSPSQFGGEACSEVLSEGRPCHPSTECKMEPISCRDKFQCDNGRCVSSTLKCNSQDDCGDRSDERGCAQADITPVCPSTFTVAPGADLIGNGFDAVGEEMRGAVLDNMFMGDSCIVNKTRGSGYRLYYRIPANIESLDLKVGLPEDFQRSPQTVSTEVVHPPRVFESSRQGFSSPDWFFIPIFYSSSSSRTSSHSLHQTVQTSQRTDSQFLRVQQVLPVSKFKVKESDLFLSGPLLHFLHALPLDYNYALYREIFQRFGTHYFGSGTLGGHYDLLYQYSRQELLNAGETEEHTTGCLNSESTLFLVLYAQTSSAHRCSNNKMTEKYSGSYVQASERSISLVRGGRSGEAAGLAWERKGPVPNTNAYMNWAKSLIDNPAVVDYELVPLLRLVRNIPCAVTKRRHLTTALQEYLAEFDSCKCAPCPNNARSYLSGTECQCICQTGTYGSTCETRAPDYTSEAVDGYWSCWTSWSSCGAAMKRQRSRKCDNPAPLRGGMACQGEDSQEEPCHISIFQQRDVCENDDDYREGMPKELPPGVEGCLRPQSPPNSHLRKAKLYYEFGEDEEFQCITGFELKGFQYINCLPDGTWSQPTGSCSKNVCFPPAVPRGMSLYPAQQDYRVGQYVGFNCEESTLRPTPRLAYRCSNTLTWDPPVPADLCCSSEKFVPDRQCGSGERLEGSTCVCIPRESCLLYKEDVCILNAEIDTAITMSFCSIVAGRCYGDRLFLVHAGPCEEEEADRLDWARFRVRMAAKSSGQEPCDLDVCYDWESCSGQTCQCKPPRDCSKSEEHMFCVKLKSQRIVSLNHCATAALRCAKHHFEILNEGRCGESQQ